MTMKSLGEIFYAGNGAENKQRALTDEKLDYTFQEANVLANKTAHDLISGRAIPKQSRIIVIAEKRSAIVPVTVGIWRAGCIYCPIDEKTPEGRLEGFIEKLEPSLIIASQKWMKANNKSINGLGSLTFEEIESWLDDVSMEVKPINYSNADDIAYILHTSGSTGQPKGVVMSHKSVINYFNAHNEVFGFEPGDVALNNAPFHFDVSIQDTFLPLAFGASVVLTPGMKIGALLLRQMEKHKVTHLIAVATILTLITSDEARLKQANLDHLRVVMTGAEVCQRDIINRWFDINPDMIVINGYGPTEVNSISVVHIIEKPDQSGNNAYPIGKPLSSVTTRLEDENYQPITQTDQTGELLLSGNQMMEGYWRNEEITSAALVHRDGRVFYKTGDLCHLNDDGDLVFEGRKDDEVKISGRRIHLGEIRGTIAHLLPQASVFVRLIETGASPTIAALIASGESGQFHAPTKEEFSSLVTKVENLLPGYMVPGLLAFCPRDALLTSNDKLDTHKLFAFLSEQSSASSDRIFVWQEQEKQLLPSSSSQSLKEQA